MACVYIYVVYFLLCVCDLCVGVCAYYTHPNKTLLIKQYNRMGLTKFFYIWVLNPFIKLLHVFSGVCFSFLLSVSLLSHSVSLSALSVSLSLSDSHSVSLSLAMCKKLVDHTLMPIRPFVRLLGEIFKPIMKINVYTNDRRRQIPGEKQV